MRGLEVPSSPIFLLPSRCDSGCQLHCAGHCADVGLSLSLLLEKGFILNMKGEMRERRKALQRPWSVR